MAGPDAAGTVVDLDDVLAHYGIKGMKWGVRRANPSGSSSSESSSDAKRAVELKTKVAKGGINSLSNKELQDYVTRMNLEKQYKAAQPKSKSDEAKKFVADTLINIGKQEAAKFAAKEIAKALAKR